MCQQANTTLRMLCPVFSAVHLMPIHVKSYEPQQKNPHSRLSTPCKAIKFQEQGESYHDDNTAQNRWPTKSARFSKYTQSFCNNYSTSFSLVSANHEPVIEFAARCLGADILLRSSVHHNNQH